MTFLSSGLDRNLKFVTFVTKINQIHSTIKFTYEVSKTKLTFLDTTLYKGDRFDTSQFLDVGTHIKPTNSYTFTFPHITPNYNKCHKQGWS